MKRCLAKVSPQDAQSACEGKERYESPFLAHKVGARRNQRGIAISIYRCPHCGGFHQGNRERR
jgi:hypothetical protein